MRGVREILDHEQIRRAMTRIAHEIIERNKGVDDVAIVGIRTGGAFLAARVCEAIKQIEGKTVPCGILDITLYRDDLREVGPQPLFRGTEIDFDINGKIIVLVDDVLYSGRTIRCALSHLIDLGRPQAIQLAILVDRGHRELPIKADYVGKNVPTQKDDEVLVRFEEDAGKDEVMIMRRSKETQE